MKKTLFICALALVAFASCKHDEPVKPADTLTLASEAVVAVAQEGSIETVTFAATTAWTASLDAACAEYAQVTPKSGEAGEEVKVKVTIQPNDTQVDRKAVLTLASEGVEPVTVTFNQGSLEHLLVSTEWEDVAVAGGSFKVNVDANVEYSVSDYADTFTWMHVTAGEGVIDVTIDANPTYDARTSYIKLKTSAIQVPVIDEEGNETGETEDMTIRVYFAQAGNAVVAWRTEFVWDFAITEEGAYSSYTAAIAGDNLLMSNGQGVWAINKNTGAIGSKLETPMIPAGIANDDAGNLIAFVGGGYGEGAETLTIAKVDPATFAVTPVVAGVGNDFYGYGFDNLNVTGDINGKAAIVMHSAAGYEGGSYLVFWQVENGAYASAGSNFTDYVGLPWTSAIWASRNGVAKCATNDALSGVFYIAYDGNYNLHYNPGTAGANWVEVYESGSTWAEGYNAMDIIEWNGHKYCAFVGMAYFPYWGMPSYLTIVNIDDPTAPVVLSKQEIYTAEGAFAYGSTTALKLAVEDGALAAYVVDSSIACIEKIVFPVL